MLSAVLFFLTFSYPDLDEMKSESCFDCNCIFLIAKNDEHLLRYFSNSFISSVENTPFRSTAHLKNFDHLLPGLIYFILRFSALFMYANMYVYMNVCMHECIYVFILSSLSYITGEESLPSLGFFFTCFLFSIAVQNPFSSL